MAELVDALASGAGVFWDVEVRILFWAPKKRVIEFLALLVPRLFSNMEDIFST